MSSPVWRRRRAGVRLQRLVREQRRLLQAVAHTGHGLSPALRGMLDSWRRALEDYDRDRPRRVRR